jgi:hypothetical protein
MRPTKSGKIILGTRRAWEAPAVTKLAISTETKSARENGRSAGMETSGSGQPNFTHPQPPAAPATKLGFSIEMAFPLSARTEN